MRLTVEEATNLANISVIGAGGSHEIARSLSAATVAAELSGRPSVGFAHLLDYLESLVAGRISGTATPKISHPVPAVLQVDGQGGIAQLGFDLAFQSFRERCSSYGIALFTQSNAYSAGELGYFTRRLADVGLVAIAATNGSAHVAAGQSRTAVFGTNPLSFAAPVDRGPPLVIDQASSATAYVNVRKAAEANEPLPPGWAIDALGQATTDPREALKGALLAFGGARGANIALMVEVLAAGVAGANWSVDAPSFNRGSKSPGAGLTIIALKPDIFAPDFSTRLAAQLDVLSAAGVYVPGRQRERSPEIELPESLVAEIRRYIP